MITFDVLKKNNSLYFTFKGKKYRTVEDPQIDGTIGERPYFVATSLDERNHIYAVVWKVFNNWESIDDESKMCDWKNPYSVEEYRDNE